MSVYIIAGINWGDEGKGRLIDYLATDADVVVRYQGGSNAGHTVINEFGTFRMHLIPSGIFNPSVINILGTGMVIDIEALCDEIDGLEKAGISTKNIRISDRATICFPFYCEEDALEEERLGKEAFGSTRRGIAPAYGDRHMKRGIQVGDILYPDRLKERLKYLVELKNLTFSGVYGKTDGVSYQEMLDWVLRFGKRISHLICDTTGIVQEAIRAGKKVLFEAQLGALRDVYMGIYPFTSSSSSLASFAHIGGGLNGVQPDEVIGVMKAFSTCVGAGPFVTEMEGRVADPLREIAHEYGAATGRPRRIGYFDAVASKYGASLQGATSIALTKLDCLSGLEPLLVCTHYEIGGQRSDVFPITARLVQAKPVYMEVEGWKEDISNCRQFGDLPKAARQYVSLLEKLVNVPIKYISVGPDRHRMIVRN